MSTPPAQFWDKHVAERLLIFYILEIYLICNAKSIPTNEGGYMKIELNMARE